MAAIAARFPMRWVIPVLVLLVPATVLAEAAQRADSFQVPPLQEVRGDGVALFASMPSQPDPVFLSAPVAHVTIFEKRVARIQHLGTVEAEVTQKSFILHDVQVSSLGHRRGYVGLHGGNSDGWLVFASNAPFPIESKEETWLNWNYAVTSDSVDGHRNGPTRSPFWHRVDGPHLAVQAELEAVYVGSGEFHIAESGFIIRARENETKVEDRRSPQTPIHEWTFGWAVLHADTAQLRLSGGWNVTAALMNATVGSLDLRPTAGSILITTNGPSSDALPAAGKLPTVFVPALAGLAVTLVGGFYVHTRRRSRTALEDPLECWEPEDCMRRAQVHVEAQRWERALAWTDRALGLAPTAASAHAKRALLLEKLGRLEEALAACQECSRLAPLGEGEHELRAARLLLRLGGSEAEALAAVLRGLERAPSLVADVEADPAFARLRSVEAFHDAVQEAWSRHLRELRGEGA